ncbi:MAG: FAD-dependent oxidoreductase [Lentisphaeria bacterium]|nr:FAD-dependent oxidoreductase [Lentisphaeria bacterium]
MRHYDVAVCGGGIAGVAAALASARRGKKTALIEKQCVLGGLATSGLIYIYLPISDDRDVKIAGGLPEELLLRCQEYGPFTVSEPWSGIKGADCGHSGSRYLCCFSPAGYELTLEKTVRESGTELLLETAVTGVRCDHNNRLTEIELFCGAEKEKVEADCFIDATGGAFLLRMAGAQVFPETNFSNPWLMEVNDHSQSKFYLTGDLHIQALPIPEEEGSMEQVLTAAETQEFIRRQYREMRRYYDAMPPERRKSCYPVHLPAMPQLRKIARIDAVAEIKDGSAGVFCADSVGVAADWRRIAPAWETPYGALVPKSVRGALAAGRCINSSGYAWEIFRVIPAAAMTGEAAGVAAALAVDLNIDPAELPVNVLQQELIKNGVILHIPQK